MPTKHRSPLSLVAALALAGCAATSVPVEFATPAPAPEIRAMAERGVTRIAAFFGEPFVTPVRFRVAPSRAGFTAALPAEWGMGETQCWMVGTATAEWMVLLDPAAWTTDACEHDPEDAVAIERLITHELVHAFHGQHAPSPDFTGMDDLAWWIEGVATYASGQVTDERLGNACRSLRDGGGPAGLAEVWNGPDRYGFAGSLVGHIDRAHGRDALRALLRVGTTAEALEILGTSEEELLRAWRADLLGPGSGGSPSRCDGVAP